MFWVSATVAGAALAIVGQLAPSPSAAPPQIVTSTEPGPAAGFVRLPAAMPIDVELVDPVGSNISRIDDMFTLRIGAPVIVDGKVVIPSGVIGQGQVVHAAKSGGLGKAGELILAARFIDCGSSRIQLRGMRFGEAGKDRTGQVLAVSLAIGLPALFIRGGAALIPAGTHATARIATTIDLPATSGPACSPPVSQPPASGVSVQAEVSTKGS